MLISRAFFISVDMIKIEDFKVCFQILMIANHGRLLLASRIIAVSHSIGFITAQWNPAFMGVYSRCSRVGQVGSRCRRVPSSRAGQTESPEMIW